MRIVIKVASFPDAPVLAAHSEASTFVELQYRARSSYKKQFSQLRDIFDKSRFCSNFNFTGFLPVPERK